MSLHQAIQYSLNQLSKSINDLDTELYAQPAEIILKASIGQHVRHIIEMYTEMFNGYESGIVSYDKRKRDLVLETNKHEAINAIDAILTNIVKPEKSLILESSFDSFEITQTPTSYERELHYNLEHTIHHMAIIRIKIESEPHVAVDTDYGIAYSTVKYRQTQEN